MTRRIQLRVWLPTGLAALAGVLCVLTLAWRDWIELTTGWDPDHASGWAEWAIAAGLLALAFALTVTARREWRRARLVGAALR